MLAYENSLNPSGIRRSGVELLRRLCLPDSIPPSSKIQALAGQLGHVSPIKPRDALHVACAEVGACDYFVTCDDRLITQLRQPVFRSILKTNIINPIDFVKEVLSDAETEV